IRIDNDGDGKGDVTYEFRFSTHRTAKNFAGIPTFLYNDGPITSLDDPNLLVRQTYDVWRNGDRIANDVPVPPVNIGPRSTPNYARRAASGVKSPGEGPKGFAGQRDDAFFVDLGSIFDLAGLRPFNEAHDISLPAAPGIDDVDGYNTNSIALKIPLQKLTEDHKLPTGPDDPDAVLGVWATASRQKYRTLNADGSMSAWGPWQQVSRLGNPLINEVIIPTTKKDYWNSQRPSKDSQFAKYYLAPEVTAVANA